MEKFSVIEVIEQAVQTERLGYEFYTKMANKYAKEESLKGLFENLALKERHHEKTFSKLKETVPGDTPEGWEEASQYLRAIVESEFFLGKHKFLPSLESVQSVHDAINFALGFEKETLLYFHTLRDVVKEKEIVDEVIKEEKNHIRELVKLKQVTGNG
jgi:rubrerythrin